MKENDIISKYGTPFYLFDVDILNERIKYLHLKLKGIDLCYAVKANTFIINEVEPNVSRLEICSEGEYDICEKLNVPKNKMVISGVYKKPEFIEKLISQDNSYIFTIESLNQYVLLNNLSNKYNKKINIMPRLTSGNQFGIKKDEFIEIINNNKNNLDIIGIEYFSGTQKGSLKKIERELAELKDFLNNIKQNYNYEIKELEYGGGFPVEYFNENRFNEEEFLKEFKTLVMTYFPDIKVILELGRSIAASCGKYYTKVVDIKENEVGNFAIVDGGMNHIVYYGQMMAMKIPNFVLLSNREEKNKKIWNICGSLCTINDIMIKQVELDLKIDDCFVFKNAGAYCMCEGISLFLSRDLPKIIIKKNQELRLVRDAYKTSKLNIPNV